MKTDKTVEIFGLLKVPDSELLKSANVEIGQLKSYITELEDELEMYRVANLPKCDTTLSRCRTTITELNRAIEKRNKRIADLESKLSEIEGIHTTEMNLLQDEICKLNSQLELRQSEIFKLLKERIICQNSDN